MTNAANTTETPSQMILDGLKASAFWITASTATGVALFALIETLALVIG